MDVYGFREYVYRSLSITTTKKAELLSVERASGVVNS